MEHLYVKLSRILKYTYAICFSLILTFKIINGVD